MPNGKAHLMGERVRNSGTELSIEQDPDSKYIDGFS
jgi:hypothetical protein